MISSKLVQANRSAVQRGYASKAMSAIQGQLSEELKGIRDAGVWKSERVITTKQGPEVMIQGSDKKLLNFCANNYLGLSSHPEVVKAGREALDKYGAGLSSVRFICGTQTLHKELESKIAKFHGRDDAIVFASCFDANAGLFEQLATEKDAIISDELNHASIIDGIRLCKAKKMKYNHVDMADLEARLKDASSYRRRIIVTDGAFSMDASIAPLDKIKELADKYDAVIFLDEAHATGVLGKTGRGTEEVFGKKVDIINSTLGKALGGAAGGYTTGPQELIDLLRQKARPYVFSNALPPPVVASTAKALDLLLSSSDLTQKSAAGTKQFRTGMANAGFKILGKEHPICPVMIGEAKLAMAMAEKMLAEGIYIIAFNFPIVPHGKSRIRVQITAAHSSAQIDKLINAFTKIGKELKII